MAKKSDWLGLSHQQKIEVLARTPTEQILADYSIKNVPEADFAAILSQEQALWKPQTIGQFIEKGDAPTKDVLLGAWRDLDRSEALLELIDNSIDHWLQRRDKYPRKTASELDVYIDFDQKLHQLTYEDNAGGISTDKLENLVIPGFSDTTSISKTIGSYKTGGKKAIFRLGSAACITTRYWNPVGTSDEAVAVQLDESWINDPRRYRFLYSDVDKSIIERGQTRYVLQLRAEPIGGTPWFQEPKNIAKISDVIRTTYTLLMLRNPNIHIYFYDRGQPLKPRQDLYDFSATHETGTDIRPQQIIFETPIDYQGEQHKIEIEVVLGCRTTTAAKEEKWGIDLYGNDRLFVAYDKNTFSSLLPAGNARLLLRGFVNIKGANYFIPWDTHKRHLNVDSEICQLLTKNKLITDVFDNWRKIYQVLSRLPVKDIIDTPFENAFDRSKNDLSITHRNRIKLDPKQKKGVSLPNEVFHPTIKSKLKANDKIPVHFSLTTAEARSVAAHYGVEGDLDSNAVRGEISAVIKSDILKRASHKRA